MHACACFLPQRKAKFRADRCPLTCAAGCCAGWPLPAGSTSPAPAFPGTFRIFQVSYIHCTLVWITLYWAAGNCVRHNLVSEIFSGIQTMLAASQSLSAAHCQAEEYVTRYRCVWASHAGEFPEPVCDQRLHVCRRSGLHRGTGTLQFRLYISVAPKISCCAAASGSMCMLTCSTTTSVPYNKTVRTGWRRHLPGARVTTCLSGVRSKWRCCENILPGCFNLRPDVACLSSILLRTAVQELPGHQDHVQQPGARAAGQRHRQHRWLSVEGVRDGARIIVVALRCIVTLH